VPGRDLDSFLEAPALDDVEPSDRLFGLGEGTVGDERLPVADADGAPAARFLASQQTNIRNFIPRSSRPVFSLIRGRRTRRADSRR